MMSVRGPVEMREDEGVFVEKEGGDIATESIKGEDIRQISTRAFVTGSQVETSRTCVSRTNSIPASPSRISERTYSPATSMRVNMERMGVIVSQHTVWPFSNFWAENAAADVGKDCRL